MKLYPKGTRLQDVPPDFRGVPWRVWDQMQADQAVSEARDRGLVYASLADWESGRSISTARDNYGWRSARGGSIASLAAINEAVRKKES